MELEKLIATFKKPIITRPASLMTPGELQTYFVRAANILHVNVNHSEFRGYVFALFRGRDK